MINIFLSSNKLTGYLFQVPTIVVLQNDSNKSTNDVYFNSSVFILAICNYNNTSIFCRKTLFFNTKRTSDFIVRWRLFLAQFSGQFLHKFNNSIIARPDISCSFETFQGFGIILFGIMTPWKHWNASNL